MRTKVKYRNNLIVLAVVFATAFGLAAISNCSQTPVDPGISADGDETVEIFEVAESLVFCEQMVPRKCLQVRRKERKNFEPMYDRIENFEFIAGFRYVLKIKVEKVKYPPKDTSGYKYYLKEIVSREKVENPDKNAALFLSKWILTRIDGKMIEGRKPFIVFETNKSKFYGNTSCNSMGGQFRIVENTLELSKIRQTKRACPNMQKVESMFTSRLTQSDKFRVETDRLYFMKSGKVVLEFKSNWEE